VNVKSLAAEAKFIREEIHKTTSTSVKNALATHRMMRLKPESRLAHLALAFVRGQPYRKVENKVRTKPCKSAMEKKINKFVSYSQRVSVTDVDNWLAN